MTENLLRANIIVLCSHIALYLLLIYFVSFLEVRLSGVNLGAASGPIALLWLIIHTPPFLLSISYVLILNRYCIYQKLYVKEGQTCPRRNA